MANIGKQGLIFLLLSVVGVYCSGYVTHILGRLDQLDDLARSGIGMVTGHMGEWGSDINSLLGLIILPLLAGAVCAGVFWLVKHVSMPHTMMVVWVTWLIMLVTIYRPPTHTRSVSAAVMSNSGVPAIASPLPATKK